MQNILAAAVSAAFEPPSCDEEHTIAPHRDYLQASARLRNNVSASERMRSIFRNRSSNGPQDSQAVAGNLGGANRFVFSTQQSTTTTNAGIASTPSQSHTPSTAANKNPADASDAGGKTPTTASPLQATSELQELVDLGHCKWPSTSTMGYYPHPCRLSGQPPVRIRSG